MCLSQRPSGNGKMNIAGQKERGLPLSLLLVVATAVSIVGFMSCSHNNIASYDTPEEYRTKTGKTIIVSETHPAGQSLSTIEVSTKDFEHNYWDVTRTVKLRFDEEGISIPFPQRDLHIRTLPREMPPVATSGDTDRVSPSQEPAMQESPRRD